ncbi:C40 family peptidase [Corynebacterium freiburgense]|uniref:C40 family peptidase n=1 Tax=Corynebacterium freiburgense TaxID=556548 RepID=UPI00041C51D2|nr:C40 family peptidase [Corynebacterium freiburgense]WJZ03185.1 putative endopeptidase precursor [Corynebacterium freiburgense]
MSSSQLRRTIASAVLVGASVLSFTVIPHAQADPAEVDQLIADLERVSQEIEGKNESVKQLEIDIEAKQVEIDGIREQVRVAADHANTAREAVVTNQSEVNRLALSKYRGANVDPVTSVISAQNPQSAIDRTAYMTSLTRHQEQVLQGLLEAADRAASEHSRAARAEAQAEYQASQLESERKRAEKEREELDGQTADIRRRVEGLSAADRERWIAKNGPVNHSLLGISGSNPSGMSALEVAMTKVGAPYGWGAIGPDAFDCSGLIYWAYQQQGKTIPRTSQAQMAGGTPVSREELQPGDVIGYYPGATHVGIYAGNGMLLHASDYGIPVQVVPMDSMPFYGARRY